MQNKSNHPHTQNPEKYIIEENTSDYTSSNHNHNQNQNQNHNHNQNNHISDNTPNNNHNHNQNQNQNNQIKIGQLNRLLLIKKHNEFAVFAPEYNSEDTVRVLKEDLLKYFPKKSNTNLDNNINNNLDNNINNNLDNNINNNPDYNLQVGDHASFFIYKNNNSHLRASIITPPAIVNQNNNEITTVKITEITEDGAWGKWGWHEPLWISCENFEYKPKKNQNIVVKIILNPENQQLMGTALIQDLTCDFNKSEAAIDKHVMIRLIDIEEKKYSVLVDDKYLGLLDLKSLPHQPQIGVVGFGQIVGHADQSTLIVKLQANMVQLITDTQEKILQQLKHPKAQGLIPFNDQTSAKLILSHFGVSKGIFKKAVGGLLKAKQIKTSSRGITKL